MVLLARPAGRLLAVRPLISRKPHGARHFSYPAVYAECSDFANSAALVPAAFLETLHATGLPWFAVLPLSAVLVRSFFIYPVFQKPLREKLVDRAQIQPLVDAHMSILRRNIRSEGLPQAVGKLQMVLSSFTVRARLQSILFNRGWWGGHRIMMFASTIWVSDALRRLMGAKEGLLKFILGPFDWTVSWLLPKTAPEPTSGEALERPAAASEPNAMLESNAAEPMQPTQEFAPDLLSSTSTTQEAVANLSVEQAASVAANHANTPWFDPTLMTEGFFWCPDLTTSDPTFILPIMFSSTFIASIYFAPRIAGAATSTGRENTSKPTNAQRIGLTIATLSFIPALQMPAGLLLYFITNIVVNNVQSRWLAYTKPIHPAPTACKRPVRTQRSREMAEDLLPSSKQPVRR
ncbi:hypothetical protein D6C98_03554 [Aureobasidium pullulans]|uniref:Uncharacterized protein n=1 Tax=Aureobasidium pullulans TaxID=5580 RepID=A0A4S8T7H5_AURPU|nr:hypothetical protein D6D29_06564 [Aureobasidium pullulans]THW16318.1 hypothetical protein D6D24_04503 [Aureobasidium pullulans]THY57131.1 hypothetical protein D6C98_03554 [Aureobasidium pullulans]THZ19504.1 hypothetical protein D6C89_07713 [Aureobasidium pullulans]THZ69286.1 hypothetical protein D6C85_06838 [Aureobasidium pullulans]